MWIAVLFAAWVPVSAAQAGGDEAAHAWGQWRGPLATGVARHADPPVEWSETKNVRWKVPLRGRGHSSPVVWGERVFLTAAVPVGEALEPAPETAPGAHDNAPVTHVQRFEVSALSREDGSTLWTRAVRDELPFDRAHVSAGFASSSPVTDGEVVIASFGSYGLYAFDVHGGALWEKDLGDMQVKHAHGEGSSPVLFGDTVVVNWDHEGPSFVVALEKRTGEELWRAERDEPTSWATPIVVVEGERPQVIVSGTNRLRAYDLETGKVVWECGGLSHNVVASPVSADGMVYAGSSYEKKALLAIELEGAKGDLTRSENLAWIRRRGTPYVPSPLLYDDALYYLGHYQGVLTRLVAQTGEEPTGPFRLEGIGNVYASPVGAAGRVYVTDLDGTTLVLEHGLELRTIARNVLEDSFSASAALVEDELYLRGESFLYCLAEE